MSIFVEKQYDCRSDMISNLESCRVYTQILSQAFNCGECIGTGHSRTRRDWTGTERGHRQKLQSPQHFNGVDNADIGVVEIIERPKREGRQSPNQTDCDIWNDCAAVEKGGSDIIHHNCLDSPM